MKKYEYKTEKLKFNWTFGFDYLIETKEYIEFLNMHGKEGWLEHETTAHAVKSNGDIHVVVMFRREIQEAKAWKTPDTWQEPYKIDNDSKDYELLKNVMPNGNYID